MRYTISESWILRLIDLNKTVDPMGRCEAVMKEEDLFSIEFVRTAEAPRKEVTHNSKITTPPLGETNAALDDYG